MVNQLVRQPLIPLALLTKGPDERHPSPPRAVDPSNAEAEPAGAGADAIEAERSWIDELAAALRELAQQSLGRADEDDTTLRQESADEPPR